MAMPISKSEIAIEPASTQASVRKLVIPIKLGIEPMKYLLVASFKGDPEYEMLEPQMFDDGVNGKGLRVLRYRNDKKVDVYWQPGVNVDPALFSIGEGFGDFEETEFSRASFDITDNGVYIDICFIDKQGREVILKIRENGSSKNRISFLAPVGNDIKNPKQFFLAYMLDFDFIIKNGTVVEASIGGRKLIPSAFPIPRSFKKVYFMRYSAQPVIGTFNSPMTKPIVTEIKQYGCVKAEGMNFVLDKEDKVSRIFIDDENQNSIEINFNPGFPNLLDVKNSSVEKGKWTFCIAGVKLTGGVFKLERRKNIVNVEVDVTESWQPLDLPISFKIFTKLRSSFRNWPATYRWEGVVDLENITMSGTWERRMI